MSKKNFEYFGKYILLERVAAGGMAEVFLARAPGAGGIAKFVAIKRILSQFSDSREFIKMFKDEAKIAVNLSHSNIVNIFEFGVESGQFFLVLDYVEGRNTRQILNRMKKSSKSFSIEQSLYIIKEVAAGLDKAHRCLDGSTGKPLNIIHRDMSPQNIMISFEGEVKIIDFGIAKAENQMSNTQGGTLKGKFGYMSPEQAEGQTVDLRTDIFSLGILLWELLAKQRLFLGKNEVGTLRKIRECNIPNLTKINLEVSEELEKIVNKALSKDRNLRYQTAAALHKDLNRLMNRQYPDFSPHEFSMFIKSLYADEILESRSRLVEYAKIPFRNEAPETSQSTDNEKTLVTSLSETKTKTVLPKFPPGSLEIGPIDEEQNALGNTLDHNPYEPKEEPEIQLPLTSSIENAELIVKEDLRSRHGAIPQVYHEREKTNFALNPAPGIKLTPPPKEKPQRSFRGLRFLVFILCVLGSYFFLNQQFPERMKPLKRVFSEKLNKDGFYQAINSLGVNKATEALGLKPTTPSKNKMFHKESKTIASSSKKQVQPMQQKRLVNVRIVTFPSGANIIYKGQRLNLTTPNTIQVPRNEPLEIILTKRNYVAKSVFIRAPELSQTQKFNYRLKKETFGYLNLDVKPPQVVRVKINGKLLKGMSLPLSKYPIPADTDVDIMVFNPANGTSARTKVRAKEGKSQSLILKLKRTPASLR